MARSRVNVNRGTLGLKLLVVGHRHKLRHLRDVEMVLRLGFIVELKRYGRSACRRYLSSALESLDDFNLLLIEFWK